MFRKIVLKWGPAILLMAAIFAFSSQPSAELPDFKGWDTLVKKGGHLVGYGLLSLAFWRGFDLRRDRKWLAWGLALGYAITDEFHQSFVPGRSPSPVDVLVFDNLGALLALLLWDRRRSASPH